MIVRFAKTESTMQDAARLADEGAPHLSAVVADEQTAGQGRHGRNWISPRGGLYCTVILRRKQPAPIITLALGLALRQAVDVPCDLRWPNDVLMGNRKLAGILASVHRDVLLAGIGVNLTDPGHPDAAWIDGRSRDDLFNSLLAAIPQFIDLPTEDVIRLFGQASSYVAGRRVHVEGVGTGVTAGLDSNGFLLLQKDDGTRTIIVAGGVRPA